jgi:hypothetical protein
MLSRAALLGLGMSPDHDPSRHQPDPQTLYNRAREAGAENRKLLVSLATGSLAFLFLGLTQQTPPALTGVQKAVICFGLTCFALAVFCGVFAFQVDAWRNYAWARELQATTDEERENFKQERRWWKSMLKFCGTALYVFFLLGIAAAAVYVGARILS